MSGRIAGFGALSISLVTMGTACGAPDPLRVTLVFDSEQDFIESDSARVSLYDEQCSRALDDAIGGSRVPIYSTGRLPICEFRNGVAINDVSDGDFSVVALVFKEIADDTSELFLRACQNYSLGSSVDLDLFPAADAPSEPSSMCASAAQKCSGACE